MRRDGEVCRQCGGFGYQVEVHHIKPLRIIIEDQIESMADAWRSKELFDCRNGISLCRTCHRRAELSLLRYPDSLETVKIWVNRETGKIKYAVRVADFLQDFVWDVFAQMASDA
jgi:hypothetical protein